MGESIAPLPPSLPPPKEYAKVSWDGIEGLMDMEKLEPQEAKLLKIYKEAGFEEDKIQFHWLPHRVGQTKLGQFVASPDPSKRLAFDPSQRPQKEESKKPTTSDEPQAGTEFPEWLKALPIDDEVRSTFIKEKIDFGLLE